ncbi:hypothetical protein FQN49_001041 [Arthroderma sp. PD_2]|nr:hypothetical protein FQN49_001041 [Arthroderma sp. PD_2]
MALDCLPLPEGHISNKDMETLAMEAQKAYETKSRRLHNDFANFLNCACPKAESTNAQLETHHIPPRNQAEVTNQNPPRCDHFSNLNQLLKLHNIQPAVSDFFQEPLTLSGKVEIPELEGEVKDENGQSSDNHRSIFHHYINLLQDEANFYLLQQIDCHGPETVYRSAFREYFTGEVTNMMETYWRPDPRGQLIRHQAHELCYQAINEVPFLETAERNLLMRTTGCFPQDTMAFWTSITKKRLMYLTMKEMVGMLEARQDEEEDETETDVDIDMDMDMEEGVDLDEME